MKHESHNTCKEKQTSAQNVFPMTEGTVPAGPALLQRPKPSQSLLRCSSSLDAFLLGAELGTAAKKLPRNATTEGMSQNKNLYNIMVFEPNQGKQTEPA